MTGCAGASIDLDHDEADLDKKVACPLLALWGGGPATRWTNIVETWKERAPGATGFPLDCGHFLAEEKPKETAEALRKFFSAPG